MKNLFVRLSIFCLTLFAGITMKATCHAAFNYNETSLRTVAYTSVSTGAFNPSYSLWRFGDGTTFTGAGNPSKTYSTYGTFNVCLILRDSTGSVCDSVCSSVSVDSCFGAFSVTYNCRDSVVISVQHGMTTTAQIQWGDGTSTFTGMGAGWNVGTFHHRYTTSGLKPILLAIPMFFGRCAGISDSFRAIVSVNIPPLPLFSRTQFSDSIFCVHTSGGLTAGGFGTSSFGISWWNFGDGTPYFFGDIYPDTTQGHRYTSPGTYIMKHWITNFATSGPWCASDTTYDTIRIGCTTVASFHTSPVSPIVTTSLPTPVILYNTTTNRTTNTIYQILLDGSVYANLSYTPVYTMLITTYGTHTICMLAYDTITHCLSDTCMTIRVYDTTSTGCSTVASFYLSPPTSTTLPLPVILHNTTTGGTSHMIYQILLDGAVYANTSFTSAYTILVGSYGTHTICMLAYDTVTHCLSDTCMSITVGPPVPCHAAFSSSVVCNTVHFTNTSTGGAGYYWSFGDGFTSMDTSPTHIYVDTPTIVHYVTLYVLDTGGHVCDSMRQVLTVAHFDSIMGFVWYDNNGNGLRDGTEGTRSGQQVRVYRAGTTTLVTTGLTNSSGQYAFYLAAGNYDIVLGTLPGPGYSQTYPAAPTFYTVHTGGTCAHIDYLRFGIIDSSMLRIYITGYVYEDNNNNGIKDVGEPGFSGQRVDIGAYSAITNAAGFYFVVVPRNPYSISYAIPASLAGYIHTSPSVINLIPVAGTFGYINNNFGINDTIAINNLCSYLVPVTNVSPLGPIWYRLYVHNSGTTVMGGTATMYYDPRYVYNSSAPVGVNDAIAHSVTFTFTGLAPHASLSYFIRFNNPTSLIAGDVVFNVSNVDASTGITEIEYDCNIDTLHQVVSASWDPNDKHVSPVGTGSEGFIANSTELNYTINFQNTGTGPAVNIVLIDTITANLDLETFVLNAASHDVRTVIEGRVVKFYFDDVMLPTETTSPEGSKGYVNYSMHPIPFLAEGAPITNNADIYFDLNAPVRTNTTLNTISYKLSIETIAEEIHFNAFPNPFENFINFTMDGMSNGKAQILIYDILGNQVAEKEFDAQKSFTKVQMETSKLSNAVYIYQLIQDHKVLSEGRLIRQ